MRTSHQQQQLSVLSVLSNHVAMVDEEEVPRGCGYS